MGNLAPDRDRVAEGLTEMAALLLSVEDMSEALSHIARIAVAVIPDGPSCGITVVMDGHAVTEVYAGSIPAQVEKTQHTRGDGPCLQAIHTGCPVVVQDLAAEERWGDWPALALDAGARAVYAHPLEVDGEVLGALSLYSHEPNMFTDEINEIALQFARPAALLLAGVLRRLSQEEVIRQLRAAISSRSVIDQAIGIVMAQRRCGPEEALSALRRMSNNRNIKLRDIAARLIASLETGGGRR